MHVKGVPAFAGMTKYVVLFTQPVKLVATENNTIFFFCETDVLN